MNLKFTNRILVLVFTVAACFEGVAAGQTTGAATDTGRCMMWKTSSKTATVFLLGSLHVTTPEMYPLPQEVEEAFAKSDRLVVEVNMNKLDQQKMFAFIAEKGVYKDGKTLPECVSKETWEGTKAALEKLGVLQTGLEKLRPWYVGMILMMGQMEKLGYDSKLGIDAHFLNLAAKKEMPVDELETADYQMNLFASGDDKKQEELLAATLTDIKNVKAEMEGMIAAWSAGDARALDALLENKMKANPESRPVMKAMIYDRNGPMAEKVEKYLASTGTVFVTVGSAHLVGTNGVVKILTDHKFSVEQCAASKSKP